MAQPYDRLRLLWPDHLGLARGKYLPTDTATGRTAHCLTLFTLGFDRDMTPHDGAMFWKGLPDLEATYTEDDYRKGWEPATAVVIPEISRGGALVPLAPRNVLKTAIQKWEDHGLTPIIGLEMEAFLFEPDGSGGWQPISTPGAMVYGTGMGNDPTGIIDEIMAKSREVGFPLEAINGEYDSGQFELTLKYADALSAADDAFLFKVMAREIAAKKGYLLTFMGKPINGRGGSGFHVNLSLEDGDGNNVFLDEAAVDGLSDTCKAAIAGLLNHHVGMTALVAPTVNAYKRLRPGALCGYWANWGYDHRGATVRVPPARGAGTRIEHRLGDGSVTPHQGVAAVLTAARLGYEKGYPLPDVETLDCIENASTDIVSPSTLSDALDALEADVDLVEAFSAAFVDGFVTVKRAEWERFNRWTSDWEMNEYLPFL
ncbi:MAG: glutamine synthetase family protein [Acidimicrobiia bacterium]|nr:glutamine synthetase family protein [Acidimicrobiia bacterium]MDH3463038.1 glutamine synthetase family protein [Acidimicrobiia bacterium]